MDTRTSPTPPPVPAGSTALDQRAAYLAGLADAADSHAARRLSDSTKAAYERDLRQFQQWCDGVGLGSFPADPETLRLYVAHLDGLVDDATGQPVYTPATMARKLAAIGTVHTEAGHPNPVRDYRVSGVMAGIRRSRTTRQRQMKPLLLEDVRTILTSMHHAMWPDGVSAGRDAFVLLAGFAGAFRRSELAGLTVGDVTRPSADRLHVFLASSKTDQEGEGRTIGLPRGTHPVTCPVCAWLRWLLLLADTDSGAERPQRMRRVIMGDRPTLHEHICHTVDTPEVDAATPLLRAIDRGGHISTRPVSGDALHLMVKRRCNTAGLGAGFGFHSLRAGFITQARTNGADYRAVRLQTGQATDRIIDRYDRVNRPLTDENAVWGLGL